MKRTGARIIVGILEREGVELVSGIPGGSNLPLYDAIYGSKLRYVLAIPSRAPASSPRASRAARGRQASVSPLPVPGPPTS